MVQEARSRLLGFLNDVITYKTECQLGSLVYRMRGVHKIESHSRRDLGGYGISFQYQRKGPMKIYLLNFTPEFGTVRLCRAGGFGYPHPSLRSRLLDAFGPEGYVSHNSGQGGYSWENMTFDRLFEAKHYKEPWVNQKMKVFGPDDFCD